MIKSTTLYTSETPLVSICCSTYNHEKFISDALDGFLIQKCNFPVEILIHEDCSTDNTAAIIKEYQKNYPNLIKPIFQKENQYSKGIKPFTQLLYPRATGKYIALCEGDDYWTDPLKLQKQVEFLEANPEYTFCVGGFKKIYNHKQETVNIIKTPFSISKHEKGFSFELKDQKKDRLTKILTVVFKHDKHILIQLTRYKYNLDVNLFYHLLKNGKGFYFNEIMGVYRIHDGGVYSKKHGQINNIGAYKVFKELYQINQDEYSRYHYIRSAVALLSYNLFHTYPGNKFQKKLQLYFEVVYLIRSFRDLKFLITVFLSPKLKSKTKELWKYLANIRVNLQNQKEKNIGVINLN
jgi:glycosyltransferase involved in cell wall biosynthesis